MIEKLECLKNWMKAGISGIDIVDSDEDWNTSKFCGVGPYFQWDTYAKKRGYPSLNLVGSIKLSDNLSVIGADNQSMSYRYRSIDPHTAPAAGPLGGNKICRHRRGIMTRYSLSCTVPPLLNATFTSYQYFPALAPLVRNMVAKD